MSTLYTRQANNVAKTWLLMAVFFCIIIALGWFFSAAYNMPEVLYFAVIFSVVMNIASYWWSDKIALKVAGARPASREEFFDLYTLTENLSIAAGLPMPKVYLIPDPAPNAFATGRSKEHAAVAVTTGLLQILDRNELEGVISHELSHIGNRDILLSTVVVVLVGFIALLSDFFLRASFFASPAGALAQAGAHRDDNRGNAIFMLVGLVLAILAPVAATLIQLAVSRRREFLADASGALLTRYPEGLAQALEKIHAHSGIMKKASGATAHLYISNPFGSKEQRTGFLAKIFSTHPPVEERVRALRGERSRPAPEE